MENRVETEVRKDVKIIKPDRWVYCKKGDLTCYENLLVGKNFIVGFNTPILEMKVDRYIAVRTMDEVALLDFSGNIVWKKFVKSNAIAISGDKVAVGVGKKVEIYDAKGERLFRKRVGRVKALDFNEDCLVVAVDKGLKFLNLEGKVLWSLDVEANFVKVDYVIAIANYDELILLTRDGKILWKKQLGSPIYDVDFEEKGIVVYTLGSRIRFNFEGGVVEVVREEYDFKFLPNPEVIVERRIKELKEIIKASKDLKPKNAKKLVKNAEKVFKRGLYGESYELLNRAFEELKKAQLIVKIPKKVKLNKEFQMIVSYKNVLHDYVEDLVVDLTDLEKYFDLERKVVDFPLVRKGMIVKNYVKVRPKFEGVFRVFINAKSSVDEFSKELEIKVVKGWFNIFKSLKREEEISLEDLLE